MFLLRADRNRNKIIIYRDLSTRKSGEWAPELQCLFYGTWRSGSWIKRLVLTALWIPIILKGWPLGRLIFKMIRWSWDCLFFMMGIPILVRRWKEKSILIHLKILSTCICAPIPCLCIYNFISPNETIVVYSLHDIAICKQSAITMRSFQ